MHPSFESESLRIRALRISSSSWGHFVPVLMSFYSVMYDFRGMNPRKLCSSGIMEVAISSKIFICFSSSCFNLWLSKNSEMNYFTARWRRESSCLRVGEISKICSTSPSWVWRVIQIIRGVMTLVHSHGNLKMRSKVFRQNKVICCIAIWGRVVLNTFMSNLPLSSCSPSSSIAEGVSGSSYLRTSSSLVASLIVKWAMKIRIKLMCYIFTVSSCRLLCFSTFVR